MFKMPPMVAILFLLASSIASVVKSQSGGGGQIQDLPCEIMLILDEANYTTTEEFDRMAAVVKKFPTFFKMGQDHVLAGFVVATVGELYQTLTDIEARFRDFSFNRARLTSHPFSAMKLAATFLNSGQHGVPKIVILFIPGRTYPYMEKTEAQAQQLKDAGIVIYVVFAGAAVQEPGAKEHAVYVTGHESRVIHIDEFFAKTTNICVPIQTLSTSTTQASAPSSPTSTPSPKAPGPASVTTPEKPTSTTSPETSTLRHKSPGPADVTTPKKPTSTSTSTPRSESLEAHDTSPNRDVVGNVKPTESEGKLSGWIIPVGAGVGGLALLIAVIAVIAVIIVVQKKKKAKADALAKEMADQKKAAKSIRPKSSSVRLQSPEHKPGADKAMAVSLKGADQAVNVSLKEHESRKTKSPGSLSRKSSSGVKSIDAGKSVKAEKCAVGKRAKGKSVHVAKKGTGK